MNIPQGARKAQRNTQGLPHGWLEVVNMPK